MEVSILLMQQIAQLFIVLLMGYVVVKAGLLKASDSKVLSVVFVYLVMPCVVLNAFQIDDTPQIRAGLLYSMGIAVGMHVVFLVLNAIFKRPLKLDVVEQVNIIYSNAAALVIPLVQALLGEEYVVYSCAFVIVQLILLWTHASACLQEGAKLEWKKILTNVNLIAIVAGALLYLLHISLPSPIVSTLSSVGAMIGPMGMLLAGMAIAEVPLKKVFCSPRNYLPVALRLIVVPIIVLLLLRVFHASDWIADGKAIDFVGLTNYITLFKDSKFYLSLGRTLLYTVCTLPFRVIIPLLVAVLLCSNRVAAKSLTRTMVYIPVLMSALVVGITINWMFSQEYGLVNFIIRSLGGTALEWSLNPRLATFVIAFASVWASIGFNMILYIGGINSISNDLYEAATIDGASGVQAFFRITVPMLAPTTFMVVLLSTVNLLKEYALVQGITQGGPGLSTTFIIQYIFDKGFNQMQYGYTSAISTVVMIIFALIAFAQFKVNNGGET